MNQIKVGTILNYIVIILNLLVGLLYTPYMLRMMGQNEYGLYSLVASVIAYLTILDVGLGNAIIRYTAKFKAENKKDEQYEMFGMFLVLYIIISLITLFAGSILYFNVDTMFDETMTSQELYKARIMMLMLIFNLAFTFPMSIFGSIITAYERFIFPRVINIIRVILNTVIMVCLLEMGYKAIALVVVQTVFNVVTLILNYIYCKKELDIHIYIRKFNWTFLQEIAIYSFWIFLNVIMDRVYWSTGQFVLGAMVGTAAVAVFAVSIQLLHLYIAFSSSISSLFLPKITSMVTSNDNYKEISDIFIKTGRIQFVIMAFILSSFIVFGRQFIVLWAGAEYEGSYMICLLFFVALLIPLLQNIGITILQARNQMKFRSILYIVIAVVSLVFQVLLAKKWGGIGCAVAVAAALLLGQGLIMNIYYRKKQHLDIVLFWKEILKMSIAPIVISIGTITILKYFVIDNWFTFFVTITIYCLVYIPCFWKFSMNDYEKNLLIAPLKKIKSRKNSAI